MAASANVKESGSPPKLDHHTFLFLWSISIVWLGLIAAEIFTARPSLGVTVAHVLPWAFLLMATDLVPIPAWQKVEFTAGMPVVVAACLALSPVEASLVASIGSIDLREIRRQISFRKAVFNRSQLGITILATSTLVHRIAPTPTIRSLLPLALLALACHAVMNYLIVLAAVRLDTNEPIATLARNMVVGSKLDFLLALVSSGVLSGMFAILYVGIGGVVLPAFILPALLSRQALMRSKLWLETAHKYRSREQVLNQLSRTIHDERSDERGLIAADLHDEILQPLYKVTLMAHVLKADLKTGQLLELEHDLPDLLAAAEAASNAIRDLIGDLRRSTLGRGGLASALTVMIKSCEQQARTHIGAQLCSIAVSSEVELALYQIAKEALANSMAHSRAENIWVSLSQDAESVTLTIRDDGIGFDPEMERAGHYGLLIMRERAASVGAHMLLTSSVGHGCQIQVSAPRQH